MEILQVVLLFVISMQLAESGISKKACFQGWEFYSNLCYKAFQERKSWEQARFHCKSLPGGSLVHFSDNNQQDNITHMLRVTIHKRYLYWIGLYNKGSRWTWEDNSVPNYIKFTGSMKGPACAALNGNTGKWNSICCDEEHSFICQSDSFDCDSDEWHLTSLHHCVRVVTLVEKLTWPAARGYCKQNHSADLATFNNISDVVSLSLFGHYWLGLEYIEKQLQYIWISDSKEQHATSATMATVTTNSIFCGGVTPNGTKNAHWFHSNCSRELDFICERALCVSEPGTFACGNGLCIDSEQECDGTIQCADGSDESNCGRYSVYACSKSSTLRDSQSLTYATDSSTDSSQIVHVVSSVADQSIKSDVTIPEHVSMSGKTTELHTLSGVSTFIPTKHERQFMHVTKFPFITNNKNYIYHTHVAIKVIPTSTTVDVVPSTAHKSTVKPLIQRTDTSEATTSSRQQTFSGVHEASGLMSPTTALMNMSPSSKSQTAISPSSVISSNAPSHTTHASVLHDHVEWNSVMTSKLSSKITTTADSLVFDTTEFSTSEPDISQSTVQRGNPTSTTKVGVSTNTRNTSSIEQGVFTPTAESLTPLPASDNKVTCWNESNDTTQPCIQDKQPFASNNSCDQMDENEINRLVHTFHQLSPANASELFSNTVDMALQKINENTEEFCLDDSLLNFEKLLLALFRNQSRNEIDRIQINKGNLDWVVDFVTYDSIFNYTFLHMDSNITDLKVNGKRSKGNDSFFLSIMLLTVPQRGHIRIKRSQTEEIDVMNIFLLSRVLSINAYTAIEEYSLSLTYTLQHTPDKESILKDRRNKSHEIICAFMDNKSSLWSDKGCFLIYTDDRKSKCHCNHTTNFAILMQVRDLQITELDESILNIITYIGCSISLMTQLITITVFICVRSLNSERVYIHRNLCFAIIAAQVAFLSGVKAVEYEVLCSIVALILHYFYTAVFVWMLVEGLHLYSKVVQVFGTERSRVIYYSGFGWGVPLILVTISASSDWEGYGTSKSCWLSTKKGTIWAFVGPAISIIIVNLVILCMVIKIVMSSAKLDRNSEYDHIRAGVKGAVFLLPLLGLTWVFGLLAVNENLIVFQYLFAIFNSLQGFFIFLFHCVLNKEVRQAVTRMRERRLLQKGEFLSLSNTSTTSRSRDHMDKSSSHYHNMKNELPSSWSEDTLEMPSRSGTRSTDLKIEDDIVVEDLTEKEDSGSLAFV